MLSSFEMYAAYLVLIARKTYGIKSSQNRLRTDFHEKLVMIFNNDWMGLQMIRKKVLIYTQ